MIGTVKFYPLKMFSLIYLMFVACGVTGDGGSYTRLDGSEYLLLFPNKHNPKIKQGIQLDQDIQTAESYSHIVKLLGGEDIDNAVLATPNKNPFLKYPLTDIQDWNRIFGTKKPQSSMKCSVENNIDISSPNESSKVTSAKFQNFLKENNEFILNETNHIISQHLEKYLKNMISIIENKTKQIMNESINRLLFELEAEKVGSSTDMEMSGSNTTASTDQSSTQKTDILNIDLDSIVENTTPFNMDTTEEAITEANEVFTTEAIENTTNIILSENLPEKKSKLIKEDEDNLDSESTNFIRTPQQIPPRPVHKKVSFGVNRPMSTKYSPHGLKRRPKPIRGSRPHRAFY